MKYRDIGCVALFSSGASLLGALLEWSSAVWNQCCGRRSCATVAKLSERPGSATGSRICWGRAWVAIRKPTPACVLADSSRTGGALRGGGCFPRSISNVVCWLSRSPADAPLSVFFFRSKQYTNSLRAACATKVSRIAFDTSAKLSYDRFHTTAVGQPFKFSNNDKESCFSLCKITFNRSSYPFGSPPTLF